LLSITSKAPRVHNPWGESPIGGDEGSRTPVRKYCHANFSERSHHLLFRSSPA